MEEVGDRWEVAVGRGRWEKGVESRKPENR